MSLQCNMTTHLVCISVFISSQKLKKAKQHVALHKAPKSIQRTLFTATTPSVTPVGANPLIKQASRAKSVAGTTKKAKKVATKTDGTSAVAGVPGTVPPQGVVLESSTPSVSIGIGGISVPLFELSKMLNGANATATNTSGHGAVLPEETSNSVQTSSDLTSVPEVVKTPPILPDNLPPLIVAKIHQLEEVCSHYTYYACCYSRLCSSSPVPSFLPLPCSIVNMPSSVWHFLCMHFYCVCLHVNYSLVHSPFPGHSQAIPRPFPGHSQALPTPAIDQLLVINS